MTKDDEFLANVSDGVRRAVSSAILAVARKAGLETARGEDGRTAVICGRETAQVIAGFGEFLALWIERVEKRAAIDGAGESASFGALVRIIGAVSRWDQTERGAVSALTEVRGALTEASEAIERAGGPGGTEGDPGKESAFELLRGLALGGEGAGNPGGSN